MLNLPFFMVIFLVFNAILTCYGDTLGLDPVIHIFNEGVRLVHIGHLISQLRFVNIKI